MSVVIFLWIIKCVYAIEIGGVVVFLRKGKDNKDLNRTKDDSVIYPYPTYSFALSGKAGHCRPNHIFLSSLHDTDSSGL